MFLSIGVDWDNAPTAEDGGSTSMSALAWDDELLVERNEVARLILPINLHIFLHKKWRNTTHGMGLEKNKMSVVSHLEVSHPRVSHSRVSHLRVNHP